MHQVVHVRLALQALGCYSVSMVTNVLKRHLVVGIYWNCASLRHPLVCEESRDVGV